VNIRFEVPVKPIGVNKTYRVVRLGKRAGLTKTREVRDYQAAVQIFALEAMRSARPYARPVEVLLRFVFRTSRSDIDGPVKSTLDAMNGIVYLDDAQIQRLEVLRCTDRERTRVEICVRHWTSPAQEFSPVFPAAELALRKASSDFERRAQLVSSARDYRGSSAWEDAHQETPIPDSA
jgi:Holliday junction resolvase RusA-like endonuclease